MDNIYGINPVRELLLSKRRGCQGLFVAEGRERALRELVDLAKNKSIKVSFISKGDVGVKAGAREHQGVVAIAEPYPYIPEELIEGDLIVVADGIQDPHNLGSVARSSFLFGATGLVIPRKGAVEITPAVAKASAGAVEHLSICQATNITRFLKNMKEKNYWTAAMDASATDVMYRCEFPSPLVLVVGGEGHGVRRLVLDTCDIKVKIPIEDKYVGSLNASVAAAVALYEVSKQKKCQD